MIEVELDDEQMAVFRRFVDYSKAHLRGRLDEDDIARMCHHCEFDEDAITKKLAKYSTDKKYEGIEEFEWQTTESRQEKEAKKKRKQEIAERRRI